MQHLVDTDNLTNSQINILLEDTKTYKENKVPQFFRDKIIVTMFFENSTRTRSSFEIAAKRLGCSTVNLDPTKSSTKKGESLEDTFSNLCAMEPDAVIIRHEENNAPKDLALMNKVPVINAGSGSHAHPTQALLDLYTIYDHFNGDIKGKTLAIVGDIINSRVATSGIRLFTRMGLNIVLVGPKEYIPETKLKNTQNIEDIIDEVDIIISLRAQLERHSEKVRLDRDAYAKKYCITKELIGKRDILIMHPGPVMRNVDITDEVLEDPRCKVLEQVKNGVYMRAAILRLIFMS